MRMRYIIVVAVLLVLAGWPVVAQSQAPPREFTNSIGMKFVLLEPGTFLMGSDSGEEKEKPVHKVTLSKRHREVHPQGPPSGVARVVPGGGVVRRRFQLLPVRVPLQPQAGRP